MNSTSIPNTIPIFVPSRWTIDSKIASKTWNGRNWPQTKRGAKFPCKTTLRGLHQEDGPVRVVPRLPIELNGPVLINPAVFPMQAPLKRKETSYLPGYLQDFPCTAPSSPGLRATLRFHTLNSEGLVVPPKAPTLPFQRPRRHVVIEFGFQEGGHHILLKWSSRWVGSISLRSQVITFLFPPCFRPESLNVEKCNPPIFGIHSSNLLETLFSVENRHHSQVIISWEIFSSECKVSEVFEWNLRRLLQGIWVKGCEESRVGDSQEVGVSGVGGKQ